MSRPDFHVQTPTYPTPADGLERPPGLVNRGPSPNFQVVCTLFEHIRNNTKRKNEVIEKFMGVRVDPAVSPRVADPYCRARYGETKLDQTCTRS
jgi:hypothetical protein